MALRNVLGILLAMVALLCVPLTLAAIDTTVALVSPQNHSVVRQNVSINLTYAGSANVTVEYNSTAGYVLLNSTNIQNNSINITWRTANGSFADGVYGLRINVTNSSNASDTVTLYVQNLTVDNGPPNITINVSLLVSQSILPFRIDVITPTPNTTFCSYNISYYNTTGNVSLTNLTGTLSLSQFTLVGTTYTYAINFTNTADGAYNLSVTCANELNLTNTTLRNINVSDTQKPMVNDVTASSVSSDDATISGSSDEFVLFTVLYGTESTSLTGSTSGGSSYAQSIQIELTSLDAGTTYYYNLTACDRKSQCNTSATGTFATPALGGGSSGGGGGGAVTPAAAIADVEKQGTWVRFKVPAGEDIVIEPEGLVVSAVYLLFSTASEKVQLTLRQYAQKPKLISDDPDPPVSVYRYLQLQHSGIDQNVESYELSFTVDRAWLGDLGLAPTAVEIYRLEGGAWVPYTATLGASSAVSYEYSVMLPGFSYFAIGASAPEPVVEPVVEETVVETPVVEETTQEPTLEEPIQEQPGFVSALDEVEEGKKFPPFLMLGLVAIFFVLASLVGVQQYRQRQEQQKERDRSLGREREVYERTKRMKTVVEDQKQSKTVAPSHDPMLELHNYIVRMRGQKFTDEQITQQLVGAGWDADIVALELLR